MSLMITPIDEPEADVAAQLLIAAAYGRAKGQQYTEVVLVRHSRPPQFHYDDMIYNPEADS